MANANTDPIAPKFITIPSMTKAVKAAIVAPAGMLVFDTNAKKLSIKTEDATAIGSWENVTSVDDS